MAELPAQEPPILIFGVDHHRTPVQIRERMAIDAGNMPERLRRLLALPGCGEAVVLSTCNRVECYLVGSVEPEPLLSLLSTTQGVDEDHLASHGYWYRGRAAVRHLFRVAASLESLVVGEYQIVHQVKTAYEAALALGATGGVLNPLFQRALALAKDVRNETAIGRHKLSIASLAVDLAKQVHGELDSARLLVVGAGEIADLAVRYLLDAGVRDLTIVNRSRERAEALFRAQGSGRQAQVLDWERLGEALAKHDIVVSSTAANHVVITEADVRSAMATRRAPLLIIDLAVPRDVDDAAGKIEDVYLYNVDHLEAVSAGNRQLRTDEVAAADVVVDRAAAAHLSANIPGTQGLLSQVTACFQDVVAAEDARLATRLGLGPSSTQRNEVRYALERVANKIQHRVLRLLREHPGDGATEALVRELLGLSGGTDLGERESGPQAETDG